MSITFPDDGVVRPIYLDPGSLINNRRSSGSFFKTFFNLDFFPFINNHQSYNQSRKFLSLHLCFCTSSQTLLCSHIILELYYFRRYTGNSITTIVHISCHYLFCSESHSNLFNEQHSFQ